MSQNSDSILLKIETDLDANNDTFSFILGNYFEL